MGMLRPDGPHGDEAGVLATLRSWSRARRLRLVALALVALAAYVAAFHLREDFAVYPGERFFALAGAYASMALVGAWHALRPLWLPPLPRWLLGATFAAALLVPLVAAFLPELPTVTSYASYASCASCKPSPRQHAAWTFLCWAVGGAAGLAVLLVTRALDRGEHRQRDHAFFAALAASMAGLLALHIECPLNLPRHLLLAHATLPAVFLLVARVLWRPAPQ